MRLLYVAVGIDLPGSHGGSTHTWEVASGLQRLGHDVCVVTHSPKRGTGAQQPRQRNLDGVSIQYIDLPKSLSLLAYPTIAGLVRRLAPAVVMERYYNLAGAGVLAAYRRGVPSLLEVNALIVDPPEVFKRRLDDRLGGALRRWATWQCQAAARIVTPLATTVPAAIPRSKIVELPWGANVERFTPEANAATSAALRAQLGVEAGRPIVVFAGSFRAWHGVADFIAAALRLLGAGCRYYFLLIGDGPERAHVEEEVAAYHGAFHFAGSVPHDRMPDYLRLATAGVAPFNTASHPALRAAGFFWSPLKIYEYMATGLPVITPNIPPLNAAVREGIEGALYPEGDISALAEAIRRVVESPDRGQMGRRARERVVRDFSWQRHCRELDRLLHAIAG